MEWLLSWLPWTEAAATYRARSEQLERQRARLARLLTQVSRHAPKNLVEPLERDVADELCAADADSFLDACGREWRAPTHVPPPVPAWLRMYCDVDRLAQLREFADLLNDLTSLELALGFRQLRNNRRARASTDGLREHIHAAQLACAVPPLFILVRKRTSELLRQCADWPVDDRYFKNNNMYLAY